jgi:trans-aconitate methyltransferase
MSLEKSLASVYTEQPTELHTAITEMMMENVAEDMEREDVRFILDVGCGMGVAWPGFAKHFPDATIHVITPDSVERSNAESSGKAVWAGETIESTACLEGFYGLIWARHSMEHTIHPYENLLKKLREKVELK